MKKHEFSKIDLKAYFSRWEFLFDGKSAETFWAVFDSLKRPNSAENHKLICQQFIGYCRALYDIGMIEKNVFLLIQSDLRWLRDTIAA